MNTYHKFCPNVFLAKCDEKHEKGEVIEVTTKYGKENESIVFNLIFEKDGFYYYSIVRADGFNVQEWAKQRAKRRHDWASLAAQKSNEYFNRSNKDRDFLSLGEPIKVGHHSEKRHRKMIEDSWNNMGKSAELSDKAAEHERVAKYWEKRAETINLSMPESIDFYEHKLEQAKEFHEGVKSGKYPREHAYTLTYEWVKDKVENWCSPIQQADFNEGEGDFKWEDGLYRPNDLFRVKVLGMFPKVAEDVLIPYEWIEIANENWRKLQEDDFVPKKSCKIGVDVAGMGRDDSVLCLRYGNYVSEFEAHQSAGTADHMHVAGMITRYLDKKGAKAFIDTIGEGAGVLSRLQELGYQNVYSCKFSESARGLHDITGEYTFANMRAYLFWAVRDWLNPKNGFGAALPPCDKLMEEATETHWGFMSNGSIIIEKKEEIKKRIKRSPDWFDSLANTFFPWDYLAVSDEDILRNML